MKSLQTISGFHPSVFYSLVPAQVQHRVTNNHTNGSRQKPSGMPKCPGPVPEAPEATVVDYKQTLDVVLLLHRRMAEMVKR